MLRERRAFRRACTAQAFGIVLIDTDARIDRRIDRYRPALLVLADDDIRDDGARLECANL